MPKKAPSPVMAHAVAELKKNPRIEFAALAANAKSKGLKLIPIIFGRAKLALGLAKRGARKARKTGRRGAVKVAVAGRRSGRASGRISVPSLDGSLSQIVNVVKQVEAQQKALAKIQGILNQITGVTRGPGRPRKDA